LYINSSLSFGRHRQDTERQTSTGTATAGVEASDVSASVTTGYDKLSQDDVVGEPLVGLRYSAYDQDSFTESGAGVSNLSVDCQENTSLESRIGVRFAKTLDHPDVREYIPSLTIAWRHEYDEQNEDTSARFTGANSSFTVEQGDSPDDALEIGTGLDVNVSRRVSLFANYTGTFYQEADIHAISGGLRLSF